MIFDGLYEEDRLIELDANEGEFGDALNMLILQESKVVTS